jgi:hypothetical protein
MQEEVKREKVRDTLSSDLALDNPSYRTPTHAARLFLHIRNFDGNWPEFFSLLFDSSRCDRQDAAMFAREILPDQAYLPIGNLPDFGSALLLAKDKVVAPVRKRCMEPELDSQFRTALNHPVAGLVFETRQAPEPLSNTTSTLASCRTTSAARADGAPANAARNAEQTRVIARNILKSATLTQGPPMLHSFRRLDTDLHDLLAESGVLCR